MPRHPPNALNSLTTGNCSSRRHPTSRSSSHARSPRSWRAGKWPSQRLQFAVSCVQTLNLDMPPGPKGPDADTNPRRWTSARCPFGLPLSRGASRLERFRTITVLARASFIYSIVMSAVEDKGFEPLTLGLQSQCSPAELIPQRGEHPDCRGSGRPLKTK